MKDSINFTSQIWRDGKMFVAHNSELGVSSCGKNIKEARKNFKQATELFIDETERMGTLNDILRESGFTKKRVKREIVWNAPELLCLEKLSTPL